MKKAILYIHGKGGSYLEAEQYRKNCPDFDVMGIDYNVDFPWFHTEEQLIFLNDWMEKAMR